MKYRKEFVFITASILVSLLLCYSSLNYLNILANQDNHISHKAVESFDISNWIMSPLNVVSNDSTGYSYDSSLVVDSIGNIHLVWEDMTDYNGCGTDRDIFYRKWDSSKSEWIKTEVISTESTSSSNVPSMVIDSQNNIHVVWYDSTDLAGSGSDRDIFYKKKDSVTSTWSSTELVSTESTADSNSPDLAIDTLDNLHVAWNDQTNYNGAGTDMDIFYKCWNKTLASWTISEVVSTESTHGFGSWYPSLTVSLYGDIHITWNDATGLASCGSDEDIFYKRWDSSLLIWTTTEVVSTESTSDSYRPSIVVDTSNNAHIGWNDLTNYNGAAGDYDIFYKIWNSTTDIWTITEVVSIESTGYSVMCDTAIDSRNNLHIAWHDITDYNGSGTDVDIFYKYLDADTDTWSPIMVVSNESTATSSYADVFVDLNDNIHFDWTDEFNFGGCGTDQDIFYRNYYKPSATIPELAFIVPNPSTTGDIYLDWNNVDGAVKYHVYRSTSYIWSIDEITPIDSTTTSNYLDSLTENGFYYYCIVAETSNGNSTKSNCMYVEVAIPSLPSPVLAFILPNPTEVSSVYLDWNDIPGAVLYTLYRSTSFIWSVEGLTPIYSDVTSNFIDTLPTEGIYYYVVVASDGTYNSTSNCQYVYYSLPSLSEFTIILGIMIGLGLTFATFAIIRRRK